MTRIGSLNSHLGHGLSSFSLKSILAIAAALFVIFALNLALSVMLASWAHGAELSAPRQLEPRFGLETNSAPARGQRIHTPLTIGSLTGGQCGHLTTARERQACMVRASGGPWSYVPAATINGAAQTIVVSGESK